MMCSPSDSEKCKHPGCRHKLNNVEWKMGVEGLEFLSPICGNAWDTTNPWVTSEDPFLTHPPVASKEFLNAEAYLLPDERLASVYAVPQLWRSGEMTGNSSMATSPVWSTGCDIYQDEPNAFNLDESLQFEDILITDAGRVEEAVDALINPLDLNTIENPAAIRENDDQSSFAKARYTDLFPIENDELFLKELADIIHEHMKAKPTLEDMSPLKSERKRRNPVPKCPNSFILYRKYFQELLKPRVETYWMKHGHKFDNRVYSKLLASLWKKAHPEVRDHFKKLSKKISMNGMFLGTVYHSLSNTV